METKIIHESGTEICLKKHGKEVWQCGVSLSSDDLGCRRNAETMSKGNQAAEMSPGLRFSRNKPTWQKIPKSKQRQTRVIFVAEPKAKISVKHL